MTATNQTRILVVTLRDALQKIESELGLTRGGVDEIDTQAARLREGIAALSALRQEEAAAVGIDMVIDAATELLQAFSNLESALPDAQADVKTLEAEREDKTSTAVMPEPDGCASTTAVHSCSAPWPPHPRPAPSAPRARPAQHKRRH